MFDDQHHSIHRLAIYESGRRTRGKSIHAARFAPLSSEPFDAVMLRGRLAVTHAKSFANHRSSVQSRATRTFFSSRGRLNREIERERQQARTPEKLMPKPLAPPLRRPIAASRPNVENRKDFFFPPRISAATLR